MKKLHEIAKRRNLMWLKTIISQSLPEFDEEDQKSVSEESKQTRWMEPSHDWKSQKFSWRVQKLIEFLIRSREETKEQRIDEYLIITNSFIWNGSREWRSSRKSWSFTSNKFVKLIECKKSRGKWNKIFMLDITLRFIFYSFNAFYFFDRWSAIHFVSQYTIFGYLYV